MFWNSEMVKGDGLMEWEGILLADADLGTCLNGGLDGGDNREEEDC